MAVEKGQSSPVQPYMATIQTTSQAFADNPLGIVCQDHLRFGYRELLWRLRGEPESKGATKPIGDDVHGASVLRGQGWWCFIWYVPCC
ncbi:hypothetical protein CH063_05444 [Colletotrichum higginsianum]|uniref:Uncharacterized protein n=1 Tax=Colletotrichum higginsianum (strain IMI 349063) TaxID=759273 RepID=H1UZ05_COLHI|nr:hypothetical protein CH063_05444 [Colletotrichum higginsianum]